MKFLLCLSVLTTYNHKALDLRRFICQLFHAGLPFLLFHFLSILWCHWWCNRIFTQQSGNYWKEYGLKTQLFVTLSWWAGWIPSCSWHQTLRQKEMMKLFGQRFFFFSGNKGASTNRKSFAGHQLTQDKNQRWTEGWVGGFTQTE